MNVYARNQLDEVRVTTGSGGMTAVEILDKIAEQTGWYAVWQHATDNIGVACKHGYTAVCPYCDRDNEGDEFTELFG